MTIKIGIVSPGYGNILSINNMLHKAHLSSDIITDPKTIKNYDKIILPGVGSFDNCVTQYKRLNFIEPIKKHIHQGKALLGICAGAQILGQSSSEGNLEGLNILPFKNIKFNTKLNLPVPHMGWNKLNTYQHQHPLFHKIDNKMHRFYFVHSFHFEPDDKQIILATTNYGCTFPSIVGKNNVIAVQFHPEKSQKNGMQILRNFALNVN